MNIPLDLPTGPPLEIWDELADEARRYIELLEAWKVAPQHEREALGQKLASSLSHIRVHSQVMDETIEDAMDLVDTLEEHKLVARH